MRRIFPLLICLGIATASAARADSGRIDLYADQARVLPMPAGEPATMIIGNPMIAEVTVQNNVMAVHGRHFGSTNLIILDRDGREIASYEVNVQNGLGSAVQVYKAGARMTYNCEPACESIAVPGDSPEYMKTVVQQITDKTSLAMNGVGMAAGTAPPAAAPVPNIVGGQ